MAISTVNIGSAPNDGTGDPLRTAFNKLNTNFLNITADGGDEITVTDPTTSTDETLNTALANIYASGGGTTPDLQAVTDGAGNNVTTNPIIVQDDETFLSEIVNNGNNLILKDTATGGTIWEIGYGTDLILSQWVAGDVDPIQSLIFNNSGDVNQIFRIPNKTTGDYTLATTDDIPTIDANPTDGSTNAVSSNGVFDALALKSNVNRSETFIFSKANGTFGSHTGNTTETVILTSTITGGVFEIGDWMNLMYDFSVTGTAGTKTIRFRAGTTGTTADALIGSAFFTAGVLDFGWSRERLQFKTGNILSGIANNYTAQGFDIVGNTAAKQSTSLNPSNNWILSVTVQLANSADTVSCDGYVISRVKSF